METLHNISNIQSISSKGTWVRIALIVMGIGTAIACLFMLFYEVGSTENMSVMTSFSSPLNSVSSKFSVKGVITVVSALWP